MKVIYVAGPFQAPTAWGIAENIRRAERIGLAVADLDAMPLIPHANTANFNGEKTSQFWYEGTLELLRRCDAVILLSDWRDSKGAVAERAEAVFLSIPVFETMADLAWWLSEDQ